MLNKKNVPLLALIKAITNALFTEKVTDNYHNNLIDYLAIKGINQHNAYQKVEEILLYIFKEKGIDPTCLPFHLLEAKIWQSIVIDLALEPNGKD